MKTPFWKTFGPGVIMASSCVGGSHIIASTQAGAYYGWQLVGFIVLINLLKYPFFRIGFDYANTHQRHLLSGYAARGQFYLRLFLAFNLFATVVNIAGGTILSSLILNMIVPVGLAWGNVIILLSFIVILFSKQYQKLDSVSKWVMLLLSVMTLIALIMACFLPNRQPENFVEPSPWVWAVLPFFAALTGWMPAPMELSVSSSMWVVEKSRLQKHYQQKQWFDFHVNYGATIVLALMFMALGALVQYGQATTPLSGGKFIAQFVDMYAQSLGDWTRMPMILVAFACIYGTIIVAVDAYSRGNQQSVMLLKKQDLSAEQSERQLRFWIVGACVLAWGILQFLGGAVGKMVVFAMTASFLSAPVFAWLNMGLAKDCAHQPKWLLPLAWVGLVYLVVAVGLYVVVVM